MILTKLTFAKIGLTTLMDIYNNINININNNQNFHGGGGLDYRFSSRSNRETALTAVADADATKVESSTTGEQLFLLLQYK
jgi:hypothetical protein